MMNLKSYLHALNSTNLYSCTWKLCRHEEKTSTGDSVPQQSITTWSFHQTNLNNVGSLMRPLLCGTTGCCCFHPLWQSRFSQEHVDRGSLWCCMLLPKYLTFPLLFFILLIFFSFAAFNGWSINPPLRLSGHRFAAGTYREDSVSLHLWSQQWWVEIFP